MSLSLSASGLAEAMCIAIFLPTASSFALSPLDSRATRTAMRPRLSAPSTLAWTYDAIAPLPTLSVLLVLPLIAVPIAVLGRRVRKRSTKSLSSLGAAVQVLTQMFSGIRTVKAFRAEERELERYAERAGLTPAAVKARLEQEDGLARMQVGLRRETTVNAVLGRVQVAE